MVDFAIICWNYINIKLQCVLLNIFIFFWHRVKLFKDHIEEMPESCSTIGAYQKALRSLFIKFLL